MLEALKIKIKLTYYGLTDHRYKMTMIVPMSVVAAIGLVGISWQWFAANPRYLWTLFSTAAVVFGLAALYCTVDQFLFDRRVKKQQGARKTHDLS